MRGWNNVPQELNISDITFFSLNIENRRVRRRDIMRNKKLFVIVTMCLLLTSSFMAIAIAAQPPVDTTTYYIGTIGQPRRVDPARAYDTASGEMIMNIYEPLVWFSDEPDIPDTTSEVTADKVADLSKFQPWLATAMPTISPDGKTWTLTIKSGIKFHPWKKADGTIVSDQVVTAEDAEYSFKRMLVHDMVGAPSWMFALPLTGEMFYNGHDTDPKTNKFDDPAEEAAIADMINAAVTRDGNTISFHFKDVFPQVAFLQILSQTWGCIVNKAFCIEHGGWDGSLAPGWSANYRQMPSNLHTPLDRYYAAKSKYPSAAPDVPAMCGTGPYKFTYWDKARLEWRCDKFEAYWRGWNPAPHLDTVIVKGVAEWPTRKMMFLAGEFDSVAVPRANMWDLLDAADPTGHTPLSGITLYYNSPELSNDVASFVFHVAADSPYMSKVPAGGTPAPDFFNDPHVRRAFSRTVDFPAYLRDAWFNEAIQPTSWWVQGLKPDYENKSLVPYNLDLAFVESELKQAMFAGTSLWDSGFETYLVYNLGNDQRKIFAELMRDTIHSLNAKRTGKPPFKVTVVGLDWPVFLDYEELMYMPMFFVGWLADFADADNFARPYMHTYGDFSYFQGYSDPHVDELLDTAIKTPDGPERKAMYEELQFIYWRDVPGVPIMQAVGRRWQRNWLRGWHFNQLFPGRWFIRHWKEVGAAAQPVDLSALGSIEAVGGSKLKRTPGGVLMTPLSVDFTIHRLDTNPAVAAVFAIMALNRTNVATRYSQIIMGGDALVVLTAAQKDITEELLWNETGALCPAQGNYTLSGVVSVISTFAYDNNLGNNLVVAAGGNIEVTVLTGDLDDSGKVDIKDVFVVAKAFGADSENPRWNSKADLNGDGKVDIKDVFVVAKAFGQGL